MTRKDRDRASQHQCELEIGDEGHHGEGGNAGKLAQPMFIAPSLPFQGDQAVDAHAARAPAPPYSGGQPNLRPPCCSSA